MTTTNSTTSETKGTSTAPIVHGDIHLIRATSQEIIQRTWTNNQQEWGKDFGAETYYARERFLASQDFASNGKQKFWVLVPRTFDPEHPDLDLILSAVETFERPGIIATKEQGLRDVLSVSIASVFTPAHYRGHGYASLMMRLLWKEIQKMDKVEFTFLYSDVGPVFYSRIGWIAKRSDEIVIPTSHTIANPTSSSDVVLQNVTEHQLLELVEKDAKWLRESLQTRVESSDRDDVFVAVIPEPTCIAWLNARSRFTAQNLKVSQDGPTILGVQDSQTNSFVLWFHDFAHHQLYIIRWRMDPKAGVETTRALLQAAQAEAQMWKLPKIVIWNPDQSLVDTLGLDISKRDESISSIGFVSAEYDSKNIEWVLNEKYGWC
ncbi:hypothetical protein BGZ80_003703 [Entomortierella chlamydospora]|uniref:LYC1 C-terminal domain-containing protein n=1 Tax=Entomortierella chlamydospora TaxID=101097 RepID=A0A9P6T514_9FUNG|nr:hypothetical protein BGZ79_004055 [Entomortierella chlamydospora]KAG0024844.1 hypothetical protein BGZ80_003703 [Entomortierella chlamydospora]